MESTDLTKLDTHFAFGRNWASYAESITEAEIAEAEAGLLRLLGGADLAGLRFLDIGCGSGIHSLAALRLGAAQVVAVDFDPDSVATTLAVLARHAPSAGSYQVEQASVFDLQPANLGNFDMVYSWGVLHHTGDMDRALRTAARMVGERGRFVFALYRRTWCCPLWKIEKRWYSRTNEKMQRLARGVYRFFFRLGLWATRRSFTYYVETYKSNRGMDYEHDVHDWMGGYPYESVSSAEVDALVSGLGFRKVRAFALGYRPAGVFGSGCDEYVYERV